MSRVKVESVQENSNGFFDSRFGNSAAAPYGVEDLEEGTYA